MNITVLWLANFKRHNRLELELAPGLNVVRGPNEAGKSTVQRALELGLFRRPTSTAQDLQDLASWGAPEGVPIVEIAFDEEGVGGTLRKEFAGTHGTVELNLGGEQVTDPAAVERRVAALTGLPSERFFQATASIHHHELDDLDQDANTLRDRLQQSMSGADRGTFAARRKLEEAIRRYRTEGAKNPGYLKVLRSDVERLGEQVRVGEAGLLQLEADRRALAETRASRAALETELVEQEAGVERAERAVALAVKGADAARRYNHYRRAVELREEIGRLEASHPSTVGLPALRSTVEHLRDIEFKLSEMRAELAAEPDLSGYDVAIPTPHWRPWLLIGLALLIGGAGVAGFALMTGAGMLILALGGVLAVGGVLALVQTARLRRRLSDIRMQNELRESEIARRLAGRTDLADRVQAEERERSEALTSLGLKDLAGAEALLAAETDHMTLIATRQGELRGLMGDEPADEDVSVMRDAAAAEANECRHALAGMGEVGREPQPMLLAYQRALARLQPARDEAIQAEATAVARVEANQIDAEKVAVDAEALAGSVAAFAAAERRLRIYEEVLTTLDTAERGTMKKAARFLEQSMGDDIERVTGGRYRRLRVDESTLTFTVFSPELNDWVDVRRLSQGTLDQLYLCARLGIVRQVTQPANPPLVLDDPFVTFDDERATRAVEMLKAMARDIQVILLTCSDRFDALADNVIVLPAPQELDRSEQVSADVPAEPIAMWTTAAQPTAAPAVPTAPVTPVAAATSANGHAASAATAPVTPSSSPASAEPAQLWPEEH